MTKTTKTITVRAKIEAIDRFVASCRVLGLVPNKVLAEFIETPTLNVPTGSTTPGKTLKFNPTWQPPVDVPAKKKAVSGNPAAPLAKPTGFDAITGEPIFKSGVGPRGGKK